MKNEVYLKIQSKSENEAFARIAVAAFAASENPTVSEITDIKTAVSEAVTNAIIHGYENKTDKYVHINCRLHDDSEIEIEIADEGCGISDIEKAKEPLYTSKPHLERSGMGFTVMETFMDYLDVESEPGKGTKVVMRKKFIHKQ